MRGVGLFIEVGYHYRLKLIMRARVCVSRSVLYIYVHIVHVHAKGVHSICFNFGLLVYCRYYPPNWSLGPARKSASLKILVIHMLDVFEVKAIPPLKLHFGVRSCYITII